MIISFDELKVKLFEFRKSHKEVISNYISQDLSKKELTFFENENGLLTFAYDDEYNIYKVYFMVETLEILDKLLIQSKWNKNSSLEIIDKNEPDNNLKEIFEKYGFMQFTTLQRMSFLSGVQDILEENKNIVYCDFQDVENLIEIFVNKFNKYSENLPSKNEIKKAIESKSIIKITDKEKIIGFLWFDMKKVLTELRYLFVDENYRRKKLSKRLMEQYLYLTKDVKKKQLWVLEDNMVAINLYKKFAYEFEELKDTIFKKEVNNER